MVTFIHMSSIRHLLASLATTITFLSGCYGPIPLPPPPPIPGDVDESASRIPGYLKTIKVSTTGLSHESRQLLESTLQSKGWTVVSSNDADVLLVADLDEKTSYMDDPYSSHPYSEIGNQAPLPATTTLSLDLTASDRGTSIPKTLWRTTRSAQRRYHPAARHGILQEMEADLTEQVLQRLPARSMPSPLKFHTIEPVKIL